MCPPVLESLHESWPQGISRPKPPALASAFDRSGPVRCVSEKFIRVPKGTGALSPLTLRDWQIDLVGSALDAEPQARMRHASARTMLDVYGHKWPDKDETTRAAIGGVIAARVASASGNLAGAVRAIRP